MKTAISFESHEMVLSSRQIQASCSQSQPEIDDHAGQIKNFRCHNSVAAGELEGIAENGLADVERQSLHEPLCSCCVIASVRRSWSSSGYAVLRGIEGRFEGQAIRAWNVTWLTMGAMNFTFMYAISFPFFIVINKQKTVTLIVTVGLVAKRIPVIGGGVGAATDSWNTMAIARYARDQFVSRRNAAYGG